MWHPPFLLRKSDAYQSQRQALEIGLPLHTQLLHHPPLTACRGCILCPCPLIIHRLCHYFQYVYTHSSIHHLCTASDHTLPFKSTVLVDSFTRCASCGTKESAVDLRRSKEPFGKQLKASSIASIGDAVGGKRADSAERRSSWRTQTARHQLCQHEYSAGGVINQDWMQCLE